MLTQKDLDEIEKLIDYKFDEKFKFLPTKDEFFELMDQLIGEVKTMRETQEIHSDNHSDISDRLEKLESVLKSSYKVFEGISGSLTFAKV